MGTLHFAEPRRFTVEVAARRCRCREIIANHQEAGGGFYSTDAHLKASDLAEAGTLAKEQFRRSHPNVAAEVADVFTWCYTFDFRWKEKRRGARVLNAQWPARLPRAVCHTSRYRDVGSLNEPRTEASLWAIPWIHDRHIFLVILSKAKDLLLPSLLPLSLLSFITPHGESASHTYTHDWGQSMDAAATHSATRAAANWRGIAWFLLTLVMWIPAVSAFIVSRWITREGFASSGLRLGPWKPYLYVPTSMFCWEFRAFL
jgi:hypothetical protein